MVHLNVFECRRANDRVKIWKWPSSGKDEPSELDEEYDCITTDLRSTPAVAIPTNIRGIDILAEKTDYDLVSVSWRDYPWIYARLIHYSVIRHLLKRHDFEPLQADHVRARTNRIHEVYKTQPLSEPVGGLEIRAGLKVRVRFWKLLEQGLFVGVSFRYTTTNYFAEPLDEVLDGASTTDYWLKMKCPSDCTHTECPFHGQDGLVGKFSSFEDEGETCRYDSVSSDRYVNLSPSVEGIDSNPPARRVAIEPSYPNIQQWAVEKFVFSMDGIVGEIDRKRLGIPRHMSDGDSTDKRYAFEQSRLSELIKNVEKEVRLPLGQSVTISSQPVEVIP
jgi:hypothetical protein